jgi:hypothetical protein
VGLQWRRRTSLLEPVAPTPSYSAARQGPHQPSNGLVVSDPDTSQGPNGPLGPLVERSIQYTVHALPTVPDEERSAQLQAGLLRPREPPHSSEGKIVCIDTRAGHTLLYDADSHSTSTMPSLRHPKGIISPVSVSVARRAGAGAGEELRRRRRR